MTGPAVSAAAASSLSSSSSSSAPAAGPLLSLKGVDSRYDRAQVLFGVSLDIGAGETVALLGRNGAGKSTLMKTVMGLVRASAGKIQFDGRALAALPPYKIARMGIGYVPEDRRLFADLTVAENLETGRLPARAGLPPWTQDRVLALFPPLEPLLARPAGTLSGGEQQMVSVGRTLMGNPRLLLLDEPGEGLAPAIVARITEAMTAIAADGVAILLSEQNPALGAGLVRRSYRIERGVVSPVVQDPAQAA